MNIGGDKMNKNLNKLIKYLDSKGYSKKAEYIEYLMKKESRKLSCHKGGAEYRGRLCSKNPKMRCVDVCSTKRHLRKHSGNPSGLLEEDLINHFLNDKIKITLQYLEGKEYDQTAYYAVKGRLIGQATMFHSANAIGKPIQNKLRKALGIEEKK